MAKRLPSKPPLIPGYSYVRPLGTGGFADVFLYEQDMPHRIVAVKVLLSEIVDRDVARMFNTEIDVMARLSAHPSVLTVYEANISADGRPYLVTEFCPDSYANSYRTHELPVAQVLRTSIKISGALETAHRARVLHRDIKPSNILFTSFGEPVLADFGIASSLNDRSGVDLFAMSVPWSSPEIVEEQTTGNLATEAWSLGATVYSLLAGRTPFELAGKNSREQMKARIRKAKYTAISRVDVPASLEGVLQRSMQHDPLARQTSALEFAQELQRVEAELGFPVTHIDVESEAWSQAGPRVGFSDAQMRGPSRSTVGVSPRRSKAAAGSMRSIDDVPEDGSSPRPRWWIWGLATLACAAVAVGVTLWLLRG